MSAEHTGSADGPPAEGPSTPAVPPQRPASQYTTPATNARAGSGYGTIAPLETPVRATPTATATDPFTSSQHEPETLPRQRSSLQEQEHTPVPSRAKKPAMSRRSSSRYQAPHKGQEFSVDDDPAEYESDFQQGQPQHFDPKSRPPYGSMKRQGSTMRRRVAPLGTVLTRVDSVEEDESPDARTTGVRRDTGKNVATEGTLESINDAQALVDDAEIDEDDDDDDVSDAESFTLKDRQQAINQTHPFGIRIWKPAIYKKNRSIEKNAEGDIHSSPGGRVSRWLWLFNIIWTLAFGWWLALASASGALTCIVLGFTPSGREYARVLWGLSGYLFYPFGKFVKLHQDEAYAEEDEGEGRSITEYEQWQSGDLEDGRLFFGPRTQGLVGRRRDSMDEADENDSLLGHARSGDQQFDSDVRIKRRLFGRGQWNVGRVIFFIFFYFLIAPLILLVSLFCWFMVFWIPMGRVTGVLFYHLRRHPLALSFHSDAAYSRGPSGDAASILLCTYRAVGSKYWKYTVDGTNIFFINLIGVVVFVIFDYFVLDEWLGLEIWLTHPGFLFIFALFSVIPLAYFIGQAVASISAQSSMGLGAAINAFFSTVVEVFLYCVALQQGKGQLVEGSIVGSVFAGILFLPGLSMCFGAIHRKTQRFNVKSAGVTSTMLLFAVIAAFGPTLFYQIYGSHELKCSSCITTVNAPETNSDCRRCFYTQTPAINDRFFVDAVRPYCWFAAVLLFFSYLIGLWFTLRTHAAVIWNNEPEEKKTVTVHGPNGSIAQPAPGGGSSARQTSVVPTLRGPVQESQLYKRILSQSLKQVGINSVLQEHQSQQRDGQTGIIDPSAPFIVPPKSSDSNRPEMVKGLTTEQNLQLARQIAEVAATAATVVAHDPYHPLKKIRSNPNEDIGSTPNDNRGHRSSTKVVSGVENTEEHHHLGEPDPHTGHGGGGGHDAPNWSRMKSSVILLGATLLYAIIAEILVNTVDIVLESVDIDEKFLGITLFALVPNTTEFLNAISFAINGNIALSMEIGSAYALQVFLLQVPALVLFSAVHGQFVHPSELMEHTFNLLFPQWDMVTVILCVFLFSYVYGEGKSNYFKGSILCLTYLVIVVGYYLSGWDWEAQGVDRFELVGYPPISRSFKTVGRGSSGRAFKGAP